MLCVVQLLILIESMYGSLDMIISASSSREPFLLWLLVRLSCMWLSETPLYVVSSALREEVLNS